MNVFVFKSSFVIPELPAIHILPFAHSSMQLTFSSTKLFSLLYQIKVSSRGLYLHIPAPLVPTQIFPSELSNRDKILSELL